jgi:CBS domain containing-hemolysin-like protein
VDLLATYAPGLAAMGVLILASAFFSCSEAALFCLDRVDYRKLASGGRSARTALRLLDDPDRLLTAVLFWNLLVNLSYFAIASMIGLRFERSERPAEAAALAFGALLLIIVFSEMLPKSAAVLMPRALAALVAVPLAAFVRLLDPILPALRTANLLSRRLLCPNFEPEPYLQVGDLERAVQLSTGNAALLQQEQQVLENIVLLSEIRVEELMRPRTNCQVFRPPVSLADLKSRLTPSGYLLVTEADSEEVAGAIALKNLSQIPTEHLEKHAVAVAYVPWCTTVAETLETIFRGPSPVAAVVNEIGETIGILSRDDILDTIFSSGSSRVERILDRKPLRLVAPGCWHVNGMTTLRRLRRHFNVDCPRSKSVTVAGVVQEVLERLPEAGDRCLWGPFEFRVLEAPQRGPMLVELTLVPTAEEES